MQGGVGSVFTFRKDKQQQQHPPPTSSAPKKPASPRQWASLTAHTTARPHSPRKPRLEALPAWAKEELLCSDHNISQVWFFKVVPLGG